MLRWNLWIARSVVLLAVATSVRGWGEEPAKPAEAKTPTASALELYSVELLSDSIHDYVAFSVANPLGVETASLSDVLRAQLNVDLSAGITITAVSDDSEGGKAGLKVHDVILNVADQSVKEPQKFNELISANANKKVRFGLLRQGKPLVLELKLPQPQFVEVVADLEVALADKELDKRYRIGVTLSEADETLRAQMKLAAGEGLVVTEVVGDSPAAKAGVKQHDVLTVLDGKRLSTVEAINTQIQEIKDREVELRVLRAGAEQTLRVKPQMSAEPQTRYKTQTLQWMDVLSTKARLAQAKTRTLKLYDAKRAEPAKGSGASEGAAAQIAGVKDQLAALQKSVLALEETLRQPEAKESKPKAEQPKKE